MFDAGYMHMGDNSGDEKVNMSHIWTHKREAISEVN